METIPILKRQLKDEREHIKVQCCLLHLQKACNLQLYCLSSRGQVCSVEMMELEIPIYSLYTALIPKL